MAHLQNPHARLHPSLRGPLRKCVGSLPSVPSSPAYLCRAPHFCISEVSKHDVSPLNSGRLGTTLGLSLHALPPSLPSTAPGTQ